MAFFQITLRVAGLDNCKDLALLTEICKLSARIELLVTIKKIFEEIKERRMMEGLVTIVVTAGGEKRRLRRNCLK